MRVITGKARGVALKTPEGMATRPTADRVKEALFSILNFDTPGAKVLDLFAGTGQLGIEALSRGAQYAVFVDERLESYKIICENLKRTKLEPYASVIRGDSISYLKSTKEKFDIIFLDPPYAGDLLENSLKLISEIDILQSGGIIATERPLGKELVCSFADLVRSKDYKYGKTLITIFRKE